MTSTPSALAASAAALLLAEPAFAAPPVEEFRTAMASLAGGWEGALTYRDYGTGAMVEIPHERTVRIAPGGAYMVTDLTFTDPGYQVFSGEIATLDGAVLRMAYAGGGELSVSEAEITAFTATASGWTAELRGEGSDGGQPADILYRWRLEGAALSVEKHVRAEGDADYVFRNGVRLDRR